MSMIIIMIVVIIIVISMIMRSTDAGEFSAKSEDSMIRALRVSCL